VCASGYWNDDVLLSQTQKKSVNPPSVKYLCYLTMVYGRKIPPKKYCKCMAGNERKRDVQEFKVKVVLDSHKFIIQLACGCHSRLHVQQNSMTHYSPHHIRSSHLGKMCTSELRIILSSRVVCHHYTEYSVQKFVHPKSQVAPSSPQR
jgi:hypothetical protein